jgi:DNA repair exonuclease SbcCD ATPase subunit
VALFGRREVAEPVSIDAEHDRLRAIRIAAEEELGRLRKELTERVASVEKKERELADAIAKASRGNVGPLPASADEALTHAQVGLAARAQELNRRENELAGRERTLVREEAELARKSGAPDSEARLAQIEARLTALQQAERAFARTQAELAAQSDDLARREVALLEAGRAIEQAGGTGAAAAASGPGMSRAELAELDERLRRLEQQTRAASSDKTFGDGLRTLERKGLGGTTPNR